MSLARLILAFVVVSYSFDIFALRSEIREVDTNDHLMKVVNLTMGRSTVLSFQDKPVKVISGNSNYFNVEFVGNDLTLQPLAPIETNLFVYTQQGAKFGFLLKVGSVSMYDDILYIKWANHREILMKKLKPQKVLQPFKIMIGKNFELRVKRFVRFGEMKTYLFDFEVVSNATAKVKTSSFEIYVGRSNQRFLGQELVWEKEEIQSHESSRARLILRVEQPQDFSLSFKFADEKEIRSIISKDYL